MSKQKSTNSKQRREVEEENQHHHMKAQRVREYQRSVKDVDRALKTKDYKALLEEDTL